MADSQKLIIHVTPVPKVKYADMHYIIKKYDLLCSVDKLVYKTLETKREERKEIREGGEGVPLSLLTL